MILRKREDSVNWQTKNWIAMFAELFGRGCGPLVSQTTEDCIFDKTGVCVGILENHADCVVILHCSLQMQDYMLSINCCLTL